MKKLLLLVTLFVSLAAQAYEPMIREGRVWEYDFLEWPGKAAGVGVKPAPVEMKFSGTTEINGMTYHKLIDKSDFEKVYALMREEGMRVYRYIGNESAVDWTIFGDPDDYIRSNLENQCKEGEILLYDFDKGYRDSYYSCSLTFAGLTVIAPQSVVKPASIVSLHNQTHLMCKIALDSYVEENGACRFEVNIYDGIGPKAGYLYAAQYGPWVSSDFDNLTPYLVQVYEENTNEKLYAAGDEPVTAIENIEVASPQRDARMYDLMGREIRNPQPGTIYIQNGEKRIAR